MANVINVKDFGATGDGLTDDTAAIQAAFDAAFGPWDAPHGGLVDVGSALYRNQPVYFPAGYYRVSSPVAGKIVTNAADNGSGQIRLTVDNTLGLANGDIVLVRGVGGTRFANVSTTIKDIQGNSFTLVNSEFDAPYTGGGTVNVPALRLRSVMGGRISGAGRLSTNIRGYTENAAVLSTNGMSYTKIENLAIGGTAGGIAFDLNADGTGNVNLQSNYFDNINFGGWPVTDYAVAVGMGGHMGSENIFLNCYFSGGAVAGLYIANYNALANSVIGGNIAACGYGIHVHSGACPIIHGVSFQTNSKCDIYTENGSPDCYSIAGCRSESANFLSTGADNLFAIDGCLQSNPGLPGEFHSGAGIVMLTCCRSVNGWLSGNASMIIQNCKFDRADYLTRGNFRYLLVTPPEP